LLGGPNLFFTCLQQAWRHHLTKLWEQRKIALPADRDPASLIIVPTEALYYACLGCVEIGRDESAGVGVYQRRERLSWWVETGQHEQKAKEGGRALVSGDDDLARVSEKWEAWRARASAPRGANMAPLLVGCYFVSTTANAVAPSAEVDLLFSCYAL